MEDSETPREFLGKYFSSFSYIQGFTITDKEGLEILSIQQKQEDNLDKKDKSSAFAQALNLSNENIIKLAQSKLQALTLCYEGLIVYIQNWENLILLIFADEQQGNIGMIQEISEEITRAFQNFDKEFKTK